MPPDTQTDIATRIAQIRARISESCQQAGREPDSVQLLAVSKTQNIDAVRAVLATGQQHLGENYLQEAVDKVEKLPDACWHFIGGIQSNKTKQIASHFDWVHTVSSEKVARRLSAQRAPDRGPINVLIQVNISREAQKQGVTPEATLGLVERIHGLDNIRLRGLMAIPAPTSEPAVQLKAFGDLRSLRDTVADKLLLPEFDQLSMGMTADFPEAIAQGATWIRIGTAIFGQRTQ